MQKHLKIESFCKLFGLQHQFFCPARKYYLCKGVTVLVTPSSGGPQKMKYITQGDIVLEVMRLSSGVSAEEAQEVRSKTYIDANGHEEEIGGPPFDEPAEGD